MVICLEMNYSKSIISSIKKETFDHTVLLRYCAILSEEIEMNSLGMNYSQNIICSGFIENQKKYHTVHFRYCAILCILDTVLYCAILCYTVHFSYSPLKLKGPYFYYVRKIVGWWVQQNAYNAGLQYENKQI